VLRYFVAHGAVLDLPAAHDTGMARALDAFVLGGARSPRRVVVARDLAGELHLVDEDGPAGLPDALRRDVGRHEIARGRPPRLLDVEEIWLFSVDLLEEPADSPGTNDPVQLYGRLSGPWGPSSSAPRACNGQLTVTRGDLLRGFSESGGQPFLVDGGAILHTLLPGDRVEDVASGRGAVLAYALLPLDAGGLDGGNETCAIQVFDGLVHALQDDLRKHAVGVPFATRLLPVVDRRSLESRLEAEGFAVEGDVAERKTGFLSKERRALPPEWKVDDVGSVAREALGALGAAFPDARSAALWLRTQGRAPAFAVPSTRTTTTATTTATTARAASSSAGETAATKPATVVEQPFRRRAPDWMNDFASPTTTAAPRRTAVAPAPARPRAPVSSSSTSGASAGAPRPDWMKDFD
jgi:hypothetical protein